MYLYCIVFGFACSYNLKHVFHSPGLEWVALIIFNPECIWYELGNLLLNENGNLILHKSLVEEFEMLVYTPQNWIYRIDQQLLAS